MKVRAALVLALLLVTPLAAGAQPAGRVWRIALFHVGLDHIPPSLERLIRSILQTRWDNTTGPTAKATLKRAFRRTRECVATDTLPCVCRGG